ncbi:MAG: ribosome recycling factor [Bacilli bacterium]|jgi:ribosome recycling factor
MIDDFNETKAKMSKAVYAMEQKFTTVRAGRANPAILNKVVVSYYGVATPLQSLANISIPEARQLLIRPFDKTTIGAIEKAIYESDLGLTPINDGENIRINIPQLTEERRLELIKQVKAMGEETKISLRNIRHETINNIKKQAVSEDEEKRLISQLQLIIDDYNKEIEEKLKTKEQELLTI